MKKILIVLFAVFFSITLFAQTDTIKVMTYNIRCGYCEKPDDINNWAKRKFLVAYMIKTQDPDLIGLQEAEQFQITDLVKMLDNYDFYGLGRDDGKKKGESAAILYKKDKFKPEKKQTLWLSKTPGKVSRGWDAALNRTVTIVRLMDLKSSKEFYFFNTHLDHIGEIARRESSKLLVDQIERLKNNPVILTGDFNFTESTEGYKIITSSLHDAGKISQTKSTGGNISFNGFGKQIIPDNKIDFIFVNDKMEVLSHEIDMTTYNGLYPSDHYPVISVIKFK
jgi:endonuclease/exonuclease/phosphatase family metal-dependent hydrolase